MKIENLVLVIATSLFISSGYIYSYVYLYNPLTVKILFGLAGGIMLGLFTYEVKQAIVVSFATLSSVLMIIMFILSLPATLDIINDPGLANLFIISTVKAGISDIIFLFPSLIISTIIISLIKERNISPKIKNNVKVEEILLA